MRIVFLRKSHVYMYELCFCKATEKHSKAMTASILSHQRKDRLIMQGQHEHPNHQRRFLARSPLLQRHPVLTPIVLLGCSLVLGSISFFMDSLFPILAFIEMSVGTLANLCLSIAFVLGIAGILVGIISILEQVDRSCSLMRLPMTMFTRLKEQSYANRN